MDQVCSENHWHFLKRVSYPVMSKRREDEASMPTCLLSMCVFIGESSKGQNVAMSHNP